MSNRLDDLEAAKDDLIDYAEDLYVYENYLEHAKEVLEEALNQLDNLEDDLIEFQGEPEEPFIQKAIRIEGDNISKCKEDVKAYKKCVKDCWVALKAASAKFAELEESEEGVRND